MGSLDPLEGETLKNIASKEDAERCIGLIDESLLFKWYETSDHTLVSACPFCGNCMACCSRCLCPPEICDQGARNGYITTLIFDYGRRAKIHELTDESLYEMVDLFEKAREDLIAAWGITPEEIQEKESI